MKILLIEDNPKITEIVAMTLKAKWFEADLISTFSGEKGTELAQKELPDLILLDLMLPDMDGFPGTAANPGILRCAPGHPHRQRRRG